VIISRITLALLLTAQSLSITAAAPTVAVPVARVAVLNATQQREFAGLMAQHQRVRAQLSGEDLALLERLSVHVRAILATRQGPGQLWPTTMAAVSRAIPGLTGREASVLATYVLDEIASGSGTTTGRGVSIGVGGGSGEVIGSEAGSGSQEQLQAAAKQMQLPQMSFNLQYLQLQSQMQNENRSYTAVSNIMKTKHDTVKNSISNIR
jgi:hypothetical protein